ncbi:hypothetical protein HHK36_006904 [Tetracentron sinense]|uniref:Fe2OG dioxygenase domain-containing protein n=1 Tax=Tetracentron sinense TaxID=13715 RepID=A0A834ZMD3_TETSI|nr:hypothetical protein HHK36_006904 [Tetracentron sinense]
MSFHGSVDRREESQTDNGKGNGTGNGVVASNRPLFSSQRLRLNPKTGHKPESYDDLQLEFNPLVFSSLERYLPQNMLGVTRDIKVQYMKEILSQYLPQGELTRLFTLFYYNMWCLSLKKLDWERVWVSMESGLGAAPPMKDLCYIGLPIVPPNSLTLFKKAEKAWFLDFVPFHLLVFLGLYCSFAVLIKIFTSLCRLHPSFSLSNAVVSLIELIKFSVLSHQIFCTLYDRINIKYLCCLLILLFPPSLQPLHRELYTMHSATFFVPSFLKAISENTEESLRRIISEPSPGVYAFDMLQPRFCELLLSEVENFEKWVRETKFRIMRPNTMNKYGAVLDDFGLETMLDKLMDDYVRPISRVFFPEVGGSTLDSHHGFVVEYGKDRDVDLGFHVDDSEVTLNVCLGKQFSGGELFFRGIRCDKHVNTETKSEEILDYSHVPGQAVLHRGRHRHGAKATTSGHRINLLIWCRSSVFREIKKYQKDFSSWCGECQREKKERQHLSIAASKLELLRREGESMI